MEKIKKSTVIKGLIILSIILTTVFLVSRPSNEETPEPITELQVEPTTIATTVAPTRATEPPITEELATEPEPTESVMLAQLESYFEQNQSLVGWIIVPGTAIDFPVYQSGTEYQGRSHEPYWDFYLTSNRDGSRGDGEVYVWPDHQNEDISINEADLFFTFAHNFRYFHNGEIQLGANGDIRQFSEIPFFEEEEFWNENREIFFSTLYEQDILYEVAWIFELDSFVDSSGNVDIHFVYPDTREISATNFEFVQRRRFANEAEFNEFVRLMNEYSIRSSDDFEYGDRFIFLLTCQTRPYISSRRLILVGRHRSE